MKLHFPSTQRNREPILEVLRQYLPAQGTVLEVASGSGEHGAYFATQLPSVLWQPSDPDPGHRASIAAFAAEVPNLLEPLDLDVRGTDWPVESAHAVVCINLVHIAPWEVVPGLMQGAARVLGPGGVLYLYGAYKREGRHTAPSNEAFDLSLRAQNPEWGVRDLEAVTEEASRAGLVREAVLSMPANNLSLLFRRSRIT